MFWGLVVPLHNLHNDPQVKCTKFGKIHSGKCSLNWYQKIGFSGTNLENTILNEFTPFEGMRLVFFMSCKHTQIGINKVAPHREVLLFT